MRHLRAQRGYTLYELIIAIASLTTLAFMVFIVWAIVHFALNS